MITHDLSHILDSSTPLYPGDVDTQLSQDKFIKQDYYNAYLLHSNLHTGTHIDAPMHLLDDERVISEFDINCFFGNGVVLDVRGKSVIKMKKEYEELISPNDIVLLYTGFDKHYNDEDIYFNSHPVVDEELAQFFVDMKIKMLGIDMPAPDFPPFNIHKKLPQHDIFILENLTNLVKLIDYTSFEFFAVPLKLSAEASFVRAFAVVQ